MGVDHQDVDFQAPSWRPPGRGIEAVGDGNRQGGGKIILPECLVTFADGEDGGRPKSG